MARLDLTAALSARDWDQASVVEISSRVETWRNELITINDWIAAREALESASQIGAAVVVRGLIDCLAGINSFVEFFSVQKLERLDNSDVIGSRRADFVSSRWAAIARGFG